MNYPLITFSVIGFTVLVLIGYFLRGALFSISSVAADHAKTYALPYVKGGSLIMIAAFAAFEQAYWALDENYRKTMEWAVYFIFFSKPITGGLAVLVAFLDRSTQKATEEAERAKTGNTPPPFVPKPNP